MRPGFWAGHNDVRDDRQIEILNGQARTFNLISVAYLTAELSFDIDQI